jgi:hypothetical protein
LAEEAVAEVESELGAKRAHHDRVAGELQLERARPTGEQAAAALRGKVSTFWRQLDVGLVPPAERRVFNRWLRCHQPTIQFLVHPAQSSGGAKCIELVAGGVSAGIASLAPTARRMARAVGAVDSYAKDFSTSQGKTGVMAWQEKLSPDELDSWPVNSAAPSTSDG